MRRSLPEAVMHQAAMPREDWQLVEGPPITAPARLGGDFGRLASLPASLARWSGMHHPWLVQVEEVTAVPSPDTFAHG